MAANDLEQLLTRMPAIAKAVNAFSSDAVQQQAFQALVGSFPEVEAGGLAGGEGDSARSVPARAQAPAATVSPATRAGRGRPAAAKAPARATATAKRSGQPGRPARAQSAQGTAGVAPGRGRGARTPSRVAELNLRPSGKQSFKAFAKEKAPGSSDEKNALAVYYLRNVVGIDAVTVDHVFTCYGEADDWQLPSDLRNRISVTASRKGWIDTRDMSHLALTPSGTRLVEHELPRAK